MTEDHDMTIVENMEADSPQSSTNEPDSPPSLEMRSLDSEYVPEEKIPCTNRPESKMSVALQHQSRKLWKQFDTVGTEMIVTRRGRRMFPSIKVEVFDLDPSAYYVLLMDMAPVDKYRYKYQNSTWVKCFEEECSPTRLYMHPESPALGSYWMHTIINFYKLKLTNNQLDKQGHMNFHTPHLVEIIVNSMHKYQPRLHIVESRDAKNLNWDNFHTFIFPGTQFTTVTAYQNDKITQLKIENNPFAKGFRSPFSRCRTRNPPQNRFSLGSNSDSGADEIRSPPIILPPQFLLPPNPKQAHVRGAQKRKWDDSNDSDSATSPKQICVAAAPQEQQIIHVATPQILPNATSGTATTAVVTTPHTASVSSNTPVYIIYKPVIQAAEKQLQKSVDLATHNMIHPGTNGATLIQGSNGHVLNGATIIQAQPTVSHSAATTLTQPQLVSPNFGAAVLQPEKLNGGTVKVLQTSHHHPTVIPNNATIVQAPSSLLNRTTLLQASSQPAIIHPQGIATSLVDQSSHFVTTTAVPRVTPTVSKAKTSPAPIIDIRSLTKEHVKRSQPPPLVEFKEEERMSPNEKPSVENFEQEAPSSISKTAPTQSLLVQAPTNGMQKVYIVAEKSDYPGTVLIPAQTAAATADAAALNTQTVLPVAYDQQVITTMPIYRFGSFNTLQPIQILTMPVAAGQNAV